MIFLTCGVSRRFEGTGERPGRSDTIVSMDGKPLQAYLAKAAEAEKIAAETKDDASREHWLGLAKEWRVLAEQIRRASDPKS
jgi:hypothetical protein